MADKKQTKVDAFYAKWDKHAQQRLTQQRLAREREYAERMQKEWHKKMTKPRGVHAEWHDKVGMWIEEVHFHRKRMFLCHDRKRSRT